MSILFYFLEKNWMVTLSFWRVRNILVSTFLIIIIAPSNFWEPGSFQERMYKLEPSQKSQNKTKQQSTYLQLEKPKPACAKAAIQFNPLEKNQKLHLGKKKTTINLFKRKREQQ